MKCVHCHGEIADDAVFCVLCGKKIPRCPTCGKALTQRADFCTNDGTQIPEEILALIPAKQAQQRTSTAPQKKKSPALPIVISALAVLVLLAGGVIGYSIYQDTQAASTRRERDSDDTDEDAGKSAREERKRNRDAGQNTATSESTVTTETAGAEDSYSSTDTDTEIYGDSTVAEAADSMAEEAFAEEPEEEDPVLYFILHADTEYLTEADLVTFDAEMCRIARNGIYARMGRKFQDEALQAYFAQYDWYYPYIEPEDFSESMLNEYQIANRDLIVEYESKMGYR